MTPISVSPRVTAPTPGNRVAMLGDSITIGSSTALNRTQNDPLQWAHLLSNGRLIYQRNAGVTGNNAGQMLARIASDVIAYAPDWCVVMTGTNDASAARSVAQFVSDLRGIESALRGANIRPVFCTPPPNPSGTGRNTAAKYDAWLRYYCPRNGIPLVDVREVTMDPATGGWLSAYDSGDGIHPNTAGAKAIGQAIADKLVPLLPPWDPPVARFATADSPNLIGNALFLVDTNTDGVPDGWTKTGSGVASIVSGDSNIKGNWLRLNDTVNQFTQVSLANITSGYSTGDVLAFSGVARSDTTNGQGSILLGSTNSTWRLLSNFSNAVMAAAGQRFYIEVTVPAATSAINVSLQTQSGTGMDIRLAQPSLVNLTAIGAV